jgi:hypothetical protein
MAARSYTSRRSLVSPSMKTCPIRCDSVMDASVRAAQLTGTVGAGVGVAGVRVAGVAGVRVAGVAGVRVAGVAGVRVAGVAGVRVAGEAEGELGDELGDNSAAVDVDGAVLGGVDATQPPMSEANNATVMRRGARCRKVLMFFLTTARPRTFDFRRWIRTVPFRRGASGWSATSLGVQPTRRLFVRNGLVGSRGVRRPELGMAPNSSPFALGRTRTRGYSATPPGKSWN